MAYPAKTIHGRGNVVALTARLGNVVDQYTDDLRGEEVHAMIFRARIGDRDVEGLDLIRPGPDGRIADFTVMVRPLTAVVALAEAVGPQLAAAQDAPAS